MFSSTQTKLHSIPLLQKLLKQQAKHEESITKDEETISKLYDEFSELHQIFRESSVHVRILDRKINYYLGHSSSSLLLSASSSASSPSPSASSQIPPSSSVSASDANAASSVSSPTPSKDEFLAQFFDSTSSAADNNPSLGHLKSCYERMVYCLRQEPEYLSRTVSFLSFQELDALTHTVIFSLFGNLFQTGEEKMLLYFIRHVLRSDFENCSDPALFLRANTFGTKLLTSYTKRGGGRTLLHSTLSEPINHLLTNVKPEGLELDPMKLSSSSSSSSDSVEDRFSASASPEVQKLLDENAPRLEHYCQWILDSITASVHKIPHGIRWISKELVTSAKYRFPGYCIAKGKDESQFIASLVGGYFFLRFVLPAVVAPDTHQVVPRALKSEERRSLTSVAKVLEKLASGALFGGAKDPHMLRFNDFLTKNRSKLVSFTLELIDVGDPVSYSHNSNSSDNSSGSPIPSSSSSSNAKLSSKVVSILPNELLCLHRQLWTHRLQLLPCKNDPLGLLLDKMGPPSSLDLPAKENKLLMLHVSAASSAEDSFASQSISPNVSLEDAAIQRAVSLLRQVLMQVIPDLSEESEAQTRSLISLLEDAEAKAEQENNGQFLRLLDELEDALCHVPDSYLTCGAGLLVSHAFRYVNERETYRTSLVKDKDDLWNTVESLKSEAVRTKEERELYEQYLNNVKLQGFMKRYKRMIAEQRLREEKLAKKNKKSLFKSSSPTPSPGSPLPSVSSPNPSPASPSPNLASPDLGVSMPPAYYSFEELRDSHKLLTPSADHDVSARSCNFEFSCPSPGIVLLKLRGYDKPGGELKLDVDKLLDENMNESLKCGPFVFPIKTFLSFASKQLL